jgi:hypothetical protein
VCNEPAWSLEALAAHSDEKRHLGLCENGTLISVPDHNRQTGSRPTWSKLSLPRQPPARQERLHHLAHAFERREGEQRVAAPRHQAHAHFRIDWQRRLLVAPAEILLGSFERAAALLVGLQPDLALAPEAVADARRVDEILDTALPGISPISSAGIRPVPATCLVRPRHVTGPNSFFWMMLRVDSLVLPAAQASIGPSMRCPTHQAG